MASQIIVPSNPVDQKVILDAVKEASDSLSKIEAEKDQIKAIVEMLLEKFEGLNKKDLNKLIRVYHKQNADSVIQENEDFVTLYTTIVG